jgi:hypothetical protein
MMICCYKNKKLKDCITEAGGTRNPKGHGNLLCNMGIISWNKNKKLKDCNTGCIGAGVSFS